MSDNEITIKADLERELKVVVTMTKEGSDTITGNRYFSIDCSYAPDENGNLCILDRDDEIIAIFAKSEWKFVEQQMVIVNGPRYFRG